MGVRISSERSQPVWGTLAPLIFMNSRKRKSSSLPRFEPKESFSNKYRWWVWDQEPPESVFGFRFLLLNKRLQSNAVSESS